MMPGVSEVLVILALVILGLHLLTDARRMIQVLRTRHSRKAHKLSTPGLCCPRCGETSATLKEAWWEVLTFVVLIAHITLDYI